MWSLPNHHMCNSYLNTIGHTILVILYQREWVGWDGVPVASGAEYLSNYLSPFIPLYEQIELEGVGES